MGPYYLTALTALLGSVTEVTGTARKSFEKRTMLPPALMICRSRGSSNRSMNGIASLSNFPRSYGEKPLQPGLYRVGSALGQLFQQLQYMEGAVAVAAECTGTSTTR